MFRKNYLNMHDVHEFSHYFLAENPSNLGDYRD